MGHKVHPTGIRLGISKDWNSKWFANKGEFAGYLAADLKVREMLRKKLAQAGISKIQIERPATELPRHDQSFGFEIDKRRVVLMNRTHEHSRARCTCRFGEFLFRLYFGRVYPFLTQLFTRSRDARDMMRYYWITMDACVPPETVLDALRRAGLAEVKRTSMLGLFSEYTAVKG